MRTPAVLLAVAVGVVLADSSVVTIALPDILARYHVEISTLAWVLTAFNLALALSALPAAFLARRRPVPVFGVGILVFSAASLLCGFAPSFGVLVAGRALQGVAGAAVVCAALDLLSQAARTEARAARIWALAGIVGAALGPAVGGILTQLLGWESIFFVQAPVVLLALVALRGAYTVPVPEPAGRPHIGANAALLLISGGLVAALFLLVILLINGWRLDPLEAGLAVTVMPLAAIAAARFGRTITPLWVRATSGRALDRRGAGRARLAAARRCRLDVPAAALDRGRPRFRSFGIDRARARGPFGAGGTRWLDDRSAPRGRRPRVAVLTPIFTHDLHKSEHEVLASGTAAILDSRIPPLDKISVARHIAGAVDDAKQQARIPNVSEVVGKHDGSGYADLVSHLQDQLDRAVTQAFSHSFLVAALLSLTALVPILLSRREVSL